MVTFGGLPVPGATVTAAQGDRKFTAVTDPQGRVFFSRSRRRRLDHSSGDARLSKRRKANYWLRPKRSRRDLGTENAAARSDPRRSPVGSRHPRLLRRQQPPQQPKQKKPEAAATDAEPAQDEMAERATDGLLINGSQNNGASSPFALFPAFGNNRNGSRSLYNGGLGIFVDNSIWDARPFSITGQNTPRPAYNHFTGLSLFRRPAENSSSAPKRSELLCRIISGRATATTPIGTALMPTAAQREGDVAPGHCRFPRA